MNVHLLRHGALLGGIRYRGRQDDPLTDEGRQQMDAVWQQLQGQVQHIITSPLSRCRIPAEHWAAEAGITCHIEPRVAELDYGQWEGLTNDEIKQRFPGQLERWREDPTGLTPPGGESMDALIVRLSEFWQELTHESSHQHVLVIGHSGSLRTLISHIAGTTLKASRQLNMPYAAWYHVQVHNGQNELTEREIS